MENFEKFVNKIFQSREVAHMYHLSTEHYGMHKAMQTYYEDIVDLMDNLVEVYQGENKVLLENYGRIEENNITEVDKYFEDLRKTVLEYRKEMDGVENCFALCAITDEVLILIAKTLYKVYFLK